MSLLADNSSIIRHALVAAVSQVVLLTYDRYLNRGLLGGALVSVLLLQSTAIAFHGHVLRDYVNRIGEYMVFAGLCMVATVLHSCALYLHPASNPRIAMIYGVFVGWTLVLLWLSLAIFNRFFIVRHFSDEVPPERPRARKTQFTIRSLLITTLIVALFMGLVRFILISEESEFKPFALTFMIWIFIDGFCYGCVGFVIVMISGLALCRKPIDPIHKAAIYIAFVLFFLFGSYLLLKGAVSIAEGCWFAFAIAFYSAWQIGTVLYLRRHVYVTTVFSLRRNSGGSGGDSQSQPPPPSENGRL